MTVALTTAITVPNIQRVKIVAVALHDLTSEARITVQVMSTPATGRIKWFQLVATNTSATGLRKAAAPTAFDGDVEQVVLESATGAYDEVESAYRGAASKAAAFRAVEQKMLDLGILGAGLEGTVS